MDLYTLYGNDKCYLNKVLKTAVARQLWRNEGYFEVSNLDDNAVQKALELLRK